MALRLIATRARAFSAPDSKARLKPEEQELARKREEQAALQMELAGRELQLANLLAELAVFERRYLHFVASRYAELDKWKARSNAETQAVGNETEYAAIGNNVVALRVFQAAPEMTRLYREVARRIHPDLTSNRADRANARAIDGRG